MRNIVLFFIGLVFSFQALRTDAIDYTTTAESVSWNGAYTSVADGFEAMLYNPAGIYMSTRRFGINLLGSGGFRVYNNTFSTDDIIESLVISESSDPDITNLINKKLFLMPAFGMDMGMSLRNVLFMTFMKFNNFSLGVSLINKFDGNIILSKSIFETVLQNLTLAKPLEAGVKSSSLFYTDLGVSLSTRVGFIEKLIPVEAIYAGITSHVYIPLFYSVFDTSLMFQTGEPDLVTGLYSYKASVKGKMTVSGNYGVMELFKLVMAGDFIPAEVPEFIKVMVGSDGTAGWGLGFDIGTIVKVNSFFKVGLSVTDIGFFVFPESSIANLDFNVSVSPTRIQEFANDFASDLQAAIGTKMQKVPTATFFIPDTAIRSGVAFTPLRNKNMDLLVALDISVSNFNKLLTNEYVTFNFSSGLEFRLKKGLFEFPIRTAFNYNSQANVPSISMGSGIHIGPIKLVFGIKGLEILISDWGAKEFSMGFDFDFEF